jgi:hypothetical protein
MSFPAFLHQSRHLVYSYCRASSLNEGDKKAACATIHLFLCQFLYLIDRLVKPVLFGFNVDRY